MLQEWFEKESGYKLLFQEVDTESDLALTSFYESGQWRVEKPVTCSVERSTHFNVQQVVCHFRFRRQPLFYIIIIFMPSLFLTTMSFLAFFLPVSGGEKVTTSITILLALVVELLVVSDLLPATGSSDLPILAEFLITLITLVFIGSMEAVVVTAIYAKETPLPSAISKLLDSKPVAFVALRRGSSQLERQVNDLERSVARRRVHSWQTVAEVIDRICLLFYCILVIITIFYYFGIDYD